MKNILPAFLLVNMLISCHAPYVVLEDIEVRDSLIYKKNSDTSFSGLIKARYPNGRKKGKVNCVNGVYSGSFVVWYDNGQKKYQGKIVNKELVKLKEWDETGRLSSTLIFDE